MTTEDLALVRDWYARDDVEENKKKGESTPAFKIKRSEARVYNERNFAIAWTVNDFDGEPRQKKNLKRILSIAIDMDAESKQEQYKKIIAAPMPSMIIESKNSYHVYWDVKNFPTDAELYREFMIDRFLDRFKGDIQAMDATRLLRVPGYFHCKNPKDKFEVKLIHSKNVKYDYEQLMKLFPVNKERITQREHVKHMKIEFPDIQKLGGDAYNLFSMNQMEALKKLSGHEAINNEVISFKPEAGFTFRLFINGERKNTWIDKNGKIGSLSGRGPTVFQFLQYYGNTKQKTVEVLKQVFPEHFKNE